MKLIVNDAPPRTVWALEQAGIHPLLARLYAARGITHADELDDSLARLLPPEHLKGAAEAARLLADAIAADRHLCVVADYDCDGATACAVAVRGLKMLGARRVSYLVPDRLVDGYGLTPTIAERVKALGADVLITVDNGIASVEGVATARALGLQTLITDHHLPALVSTPGAMDSIATSSANTCRSPSKSLAPHHAAQPSGSATLSAAPSGSLSGTPSGNLSDSPPGSAAQPGAPSSTVAPSATAAPLATAVPCTPVAPPSPSSATAPSNAHPCATAVLPDADVIVNPNQPGCGFESKALAGVGVMFYVLLALRAELRTRGVFDATSADAAPPPRPQPRLDALLPLVALGTVADVVRLDANNRRLVSQGLKRLLRQAFPCGIAALFVASGRKLEAASAADLGFAIGPRINAAGRLADMTLGIELLLTDDPARAAELARQLDAINRERREIEDGMREQALAIAESLFEPGQQPPAALTVFDPDFHEGVVGIVAARLKDRLHRPVFVFAASSAPGQAHRLKGSGRSIAGFHLRDALDLMQKRHPGLLHRFGGHAMAAGCTIDEDQLDTFEQALTEVAAQWLDAATLQRRCLTDGPLPPQYRRADVAQTLQRGVWGQGFAPPLFCEELDVLSQRRVGEKHLALKLRHQGEPVDGIWFGRSEPLPAKIKAAFRMESDEWQGMKRVRFLMESLED